MAEYVLHLSSRPDRKSKRVKHEVRASGASTREAAERAADAVSKATGHPRRLTVLHGSWDLSSREGRGAYDRYSKFRSGSLGFGESVVADLVRSLREQVDRTVRIADQHAHNTHRELAREFNRKAALSGKLSDQYGNSGHEALAKAAMDHGHDSDRYKTARKDFVKKFTELKSRER